MLVSESSLIVRPAHLMLVLNCESRSLQMKIKAGQVPPPDGRGSGALKLWRLSTIRNWNPAIAADVEALLSLPAFAPAKAA